MLVDPGGVNPKPYPTFEKNLIRIPPKFDLISFYIPNPDPYPAIKSRILNPALK